MVHKSLNEYKNNILKTGFPLEFKLSQILESHGWSLIHSRYYIDQMDEIEREIDIIAYKSSTFDELKLCTVLIISSKKSEKECWAFLTRKYDRKDPNIDHLPIHNSTNHLILNFMFDNSDWKNEIKKEIRNKDFLKKVYGFDKRIFAFQQMCKKKKTAQNDNEIFSSIRSLIRAEAFEKNSIERRISGQFLYNFNLISVADTEFIDFHFKTEDPEIYEIDHIKYLNRHIIKEEDNFYKVDFVRFDKFDEYLNCYDKLHDWNVKFYKYLIDTYYKNAVKNYNFRELFIKKFRDKIIWLISYRIKKQSKLDKSIINQLEVYLDYDLNHNLLIIEVTRDPQAIKFLNMDDTINTHTKKVLSDVYRYEGDFIFAEVSDIPF